MQNFCSGSSVPLFLPLCALVSHRHNGEHTYCMRLKDSLHIKQSPQCLVDRKTCRLSTTIIVIVITNFMAVINAAHYIFSALCCLSPLGLGGAIWIVLASELWADVHMCYLWHANCQAYTLRALLLWGGGKWCLKWWLFHPPEKELYGSTMNK